MYKRRGTGGGSRFGERSTSQPRTEDRTEWLQRGVVSSVSHVLVPWVTLFGSHSGPLRSYVTSDTGFLDWTFTYRAGTTSHVPRLGSLKRFLTSDILVSVSLDECSWDEIYHRYKEYPNPQSLRRGGMYLYLTLWIHLPTSYSPRSKEGQRHPLISIRSPPSTLLNTLCLNLDLCSLSTNRSISMST